MHAVIQQIWKERTEIQQAFTGRHENALIAAAERIAESLTAGGKILLFGNGGSAADAQHLAAEFVNRFTIERPPLAAVALTTDTSVLTSIGNDYHFNRIFQKQILAIGRKTDVAVGFSTSGNSPNVIVALDAAREMGMTTIGLTGPAPNQVAERVDILFSVPSPVTARIQEIHITVGHILCDLVDRILFPHSF